MGERLGVVIHSLFFDASNDPHRQHSFVARGDMAYAVGRGDDTHEGFSDSEYRIIDNVFQMIEQKITEEQNGA
jgi:hypothetical protein